MTAALLAASAVATVLAYPPLGLWPLGLVMLAPLVAALEGQSARAAFGAAWLYSVGMALVLGRWLVHALAVEYEVALAPAWAFTALVIAGCALCPAAAAAGYAALRPRLTPAAAPLAFAALWALGEALRSEALGVPWLLAAHPLARQPLWLQTADLGGRYAVGFTLLAANAGIGLALVRRSAAPLIAPAAVVALALGYGAWRLGPGAPLATESVRVGVVQAAVPQSERFQRGSALRNVERHARLTRELAAREPLDLVVWSETAVDIDLDETPALRLQLALLARQIGVPLVTGAPRSAGGRRTNSVVLIDPARGLADTYAKQRLVPFSEYDPALAAPLAPLLGPVTEGEPYVPGAAAHVFRGAPIPFAAPVCFEITYPGLNRAFRAAGAELLVNLSNDAWFGRGGYAEMHFAHAVLRAVELRSWVVRGANTGISAVIDPAGRVRSELGVFEQGTLSAGLGAAGPAPFYARAGDGPVLLTCAGALVGSIAVSRHRAPAAGGRDAGRRRGGRRRGAARRRGR